MMEKFMKLNGEAMTNFRVTGSTHARVTPSDLDNPEKSDSTTPKVSYSDYIVSPEWDFVKEKSFLIWGGKCLCCGSKERIERHHLFYRDNVADNRPSEIIPLCYECHQAAHQAAHQDNDNKNGLPKDRESLNNLVNHLFLTIRNRRGLLISTFTDACKQFWRVFQPFEKELFAEKRIIKVKTVWTKKEIEMLRKRQGKNGKRGKKKSQTYWIERKSRRDKLKRSRSF